MPDTKITALTALTAADPANDVLPIVDVSDTTMAASGTTKKISINNVLGASGTATLASATISGDLTVDTSTLKVDSANNRVIVGHTSGSSAFQVTNAGAAGFEVQPTGVNSAPAILSYNRSSPAWLQLTYGASSHVFQLSGTDGMTLNATGLGVGVASPTSKLTIGTGSYSAAASGTTGMYTTASGLEMLSDSYFFGSRTGGVLMTLTAAGNLGIGVTPAGTGGCLQLKSGITFPATQVASSDANTLDDYEEGTWTGTLKGLTTDPTTPVTATGRYTKIGRQVSVDINFSGVNTTGASGQIKVSGVPFTSNGTVPSTGPVMMSSIGTFTGVPAAFIGTGTTEIELYAFSSAGAQTFVTHNAGTTRSLWVSLTYTV